METKEKLFYRVGERYAITLNPADVHQAYEKIPDGSPDEGREGRFYNHIYRILLKAMKNPFHFIVEISEPYGQQQHGYFGPRLHIHGVAVFETITELRYFLYKGYHLLCSIGRFEINMCHPEWLEYMNKQNIVSECFRTMKQGELLQPETPVPESVQQEIKKHEENTKKIKNRRRTRRLRQTARKRGRPRRPRPRPDPVEIEQRKIDMAEAKREGIQIII